MDMVNVKINGRDYLVPKGSTVLEAAKIAGVDIPTLCYLKDINEIGACRLCLVEVKGARGLVTACVYPVNEGMEIFTNTPKVVKARKMNLELLLSGHRESACLAFVPPTASFRSFAVITVLRKQPLKAREIIMTLRALVPQLSEITTSACFAVVALLHVRTRALAL
jgi:ferredoxin